MRTVHTIYKGRTLTATEQADGAWQVEIDAEGRGILTERHATLEGAMAAARHFIDLQNRSLQ